MKHLTVSKKNNDPWLGKKATEKDYDVLFEEDVTLLRADGSILCILLKKALSPENAALAWPSLRDMPITTNNRGIASGEERYFRNNQYVAQEVESGIIGYYERTSRMPFCRACSWNLKQPDKWSKLFPMIKEVDRKFRETDPHHYEIQKAFAMKAHKDFVIEGTMFSTLTVNRNFRTAYHKDAGNLPEGISCMAVFRQGKWVGANLCFPEYKAAVKLDNLDLIIFNPHEIHGNTPLVKITPDAIRCSVVFYFREKIQECLSAPEELDRVKNRKQGEHLHTIKRRKKNDDQSNIHSDQEEGEDVLDTTPSE
jgi:hypothetical protein